MSTSAISSSSLNQQLQTYFQARQSDLQQLGQALQSGNVNEAQTDFNNITSLGQNGPFPNGEPFAIEQREQDFSAVGQALQNGNLAGAQQAFSQLKSTFSHVTSESTGTGSSGGSSAGPEIVLNLSAPASYTTTPEQITINLSDSSSGGEQLSLSVGNQGSSNPEQVTLNLPSNSNEQVVLNLLGGSSAASSTTGSGISVSA
ncbi:MAG TPA: hypothetical protein VMF10_12940 [Candidatus Aquilonibacter sp.]|nr:hypothetical protein [Candidatus Aquilonibacter sp.]